MLNKEMDKLSAFTFTCFIPEELKGQIGAMHVACVNFLCIGDETIGYTIVADMEAKPASELVEWTSSSLELFDIRRVANSPNSFEAYAEEMRNTAGAQGLVKPQFEP
jgi:hypothetical protein